MPSNWCCSSSQGSSGVMFLAFHLCFCTFLSFFFVSPPASGALSLSVSICTLLSINQWLQSSTCRCTLWRGLSTDWSSGERERESPLKPSIVFALVCPVYFSWSWLIFVHWGCLLLFALWQVFGAVLSCSWRLLPCLYDNCWLAGELALSGFLQVNQTFYLQQPFITALVDLQLLLMIYLFG